MTQVQRFLKRLQKFLDEVGAKPGDSSIYRWRVETQAGGLLITVHHKPDEKRVKIWSVFTRFCEPARGVAFYGSCFANGQVNPYSGKWNHHYRSWDVCLDLFERDVRAILLSGQQ